MAHTHLDLLHGSHGDDHLERMLRHVPGMDIRFDGDCAQAGGLYLPIVAINLDRRRDRWDTLSKRMSVAGLTKLIRAPAVEGAQLSDDRITALLGVSADRLDPAPLEQIILARRRALLSENRPLLPISPAG
ncbi:MAG TPA: hypothetical protein VHI72_19180 [Hyphomicrobiaceae bacterium]|jgi:hypothetical protein|nr:hypothetical protein [Hyphomicrobiaceae bacterium]